MKNNVLIKNNQLQPNKASVQGKYTLINGEQFYKISNFDLMRPFFMSIVSSSNLWMFIGSNGGLTAGRTNANHALFPYYTDDKIIDLAHTIGSKTIVRVAHNESWQLWEPLSPDHQNVYKVERSIYKNYFGNKILFEEINQDLGLTFQYSWNMSDEFGFVRKSKIINNGLNTKRVQLLDGLQNILPSGLNSAIQQSSSNLVDAYKKCESDPDSGLGIYSLSAIIVDKPEPSEALIATLVFALGVQDTHRLLCSRQVNQFRYTGEFSPEIDIKGERGSYFIKIDQSLKEGEEYEWTIVADVDKNLSDVISINQLLNDPDSAAIQINESISSGTKHLTQLVGRSDGLQHTNNQINDNRHYANTLFNIMRGGLPGLDYEIPIADYIQYINHFNKEVASRNRKELEKIKSPLTYRSLVTWVQNQNDPQLERLTIEYLPLIFSRRHGDPSRPWNKFSIELKTLTGELSFNYEGNWRDIFQNWEALAMAYPDFINGMIAKFVNASTADGYNPYRITKQGIDWETIEPDDPWSFIGYWGDHQIIYLQKLLEVSWNHHPDQLIELLDKKICSYSNVPYRIKSYEDIVKNARDTIDFNHVLHLKIEKRVEEIGADGKMILNRKGDVYLVNFLEKLLVMILTKFSNFVPEGGIWLNTQRPEWNDANNALVGNGISMVTLYYMYRFQKFFHLLLAKSNHSEFEISKSLHSFFEQINNTLEQFSHTLSSNTTDKTRREIVDQLGRAGESYRNEIYSNAPDEQFTIISSKDIKSFIDLSLKYIVHSIRANKRRDGLYHSYNLLDLSDNNQAKIERLYEMLEGQVSVLSAGFLQPDLVIEVLQSLKSSALWREDQYTYILYPDRTLPRFQEKNVIPEDFITKSNLIQKLIKDKNKDIIYTDPRGGVHFNTNFNNAEKLKDALDNLAGGPYHALAQKDRNLLLEIYENLFNHKAFTGRSGTFFGYEGLGSIYWHMVSKLRLAVAENFYWAVDNGADESVIDSLKQHYYDIEKGIPHNKDPQNYGAFPMDPYSHTPAHKGAQQPGMTGQVKEDILARFLEFGVRVMGGKISFSPALLQQNEFLSVQSNFDYFNTSGQKVNIKIPKNSLAFTYCQTPVIYKRAEQNELTIFYSDGPTKKLIGLELDEDTSNHLFNRDGVIKKVEVSFSNL